jgi:uncharacterized SAM-dependent methyltransferase
VVVRFAEADAIQREVAEIVALAFRAHDLRELAHNLDKQRKMLTALGERKKERYINVCLGRYDP